MGEIWNKKRSVEDNPTQWSVILAIVLLLLAPCVGLAAIYYFYVNGTAVGVWLIAAGLCLLAFSLPLLAIFFSWRRSRLERERRQPR
jgi:O-antigen/teichoic acid export membrane protein